MNYQCIYRDKGIAEIIDPTGHSHLIDFNKQGGVFVLEAIIAAAIGNAVNDAKRQARAAVYGNATNEGSAA
jgi:hypothetical protein